MKKGKQYFHQFRVYKEQKIYKMDFHLNSEWNSIQYSIYKYYNFYIFIYSIFVTFLYLNAYQIVKKN